MSANDHIYVISQGLYIILQVPSRMSTAVEYIRADLTCRTHEN